MKSVLLLDDDDVIAGSLSRYLSMNGCAVDVAVDPLHGETLMAEKSYDVIVVDPYLTGGIHRDHNELIETVCRMQPQATVIVLTGYGSPALARVAADCNISALLTKPQSVVFLSQLITAQ
jgi:DNA-binding NtrC family response regulator